jgi:WD40 repeat protein
LTGHIFRINDVRYSSDGKFVVSASRDHKVRIWDPEGGDLLATLSGHTGPVNCVDVAGDNHLIASGADDGLAILWGTPEP